MPAKIAFFDAKPYDRKSFNEISSNYDFDITYFDARLNAQTCDLIKGFAGVCVFVNDDINNKVIAHLAGNGVKVIGLRCAGYNNVDFKAAYEKIHVVRVPAYSPYAVAEHAVALMMTLNRKTHKAYLRVREGNFSLNGLLGFDMFNKTAGIIGTGKIARCLIAILKGFGMQVLAYDPFPDLEYAAAIGIRYVDLPELYANADVISLHCPLTPETTHMINAQAIVQMKPGAMIINTGRGRLIDTVALIEGLKSGKIGSAGLDVYEEESEYFFEDRSDQLIADDVLARLLTFPNVLVTSHQAFFTGEALRNIAETTMTNFTEFFNGGYLANEICYKCNKACRKKAGQRCF
ncbi:MAG: 2-hydroxyacid dehydrogenase [Candidatus Riflebacteria bacterium]|nr:2-hydroxyacid dehydrogenase [Candidatus Riflebacteria bacterium]